MKNSILMLAILLISFYASSQGLYPKGCYMNYEELKAKTPNVNYYVTIEKRTNSDIKMNGGNDYKLISPNRTTKRKILKKEILAYSDGDTLFLNCLPYKLQTWYAKVISDGKYFVFIAGIPNDKAMQSAEMQAEIAFGAVGGAFAGASLAMKRYLYILDKETNKVNMIDSEVMTNLLENYPDLLKQYNSDRKKNEVHTQVEYLKLLNKNY